MTDTASYIRDEFAKHFRVLRSRVHVFFRDDETILVNVIKLNDPIHTSYVMPVSSDDDVYLFFNVNDANDIVEFPID